VADYFPLVSQAVARLTKNDSESRRALYGRARLALVEQLREITPPLSDTQLLREQIDLENAIRKVESQHAAPSNVNPGIVAPNVKAGTVTPIAPMPKLFPKSAE
jgi:hypothetical protein